MWYEWRQRLAMVPPFFCSEDLPVACAPIEMI